MNLEINHNLYEENKNKSKRTFRKKSNKIKNKTNNDDNKNKIKTKRIYNRKVKKN